MSRFDHSPERLLDLFERAAIGPLAARIAHDINNPLAGMKSAFFLLKDAVPKEHEYFEYVGLIEGEMDRIAELVRAMHQAYRKHRRQLEWLRPREDLIEEAARLLRSFSTAHGVELRIPRTEELPRVRVLGDDVLQALLPLIRNAIEASCEGGNVELLAEVGAADLKITVTDRGKGIAPDVLPMIFEPFFTTKEDGRAAGSGVGLTVCASALKSVGGQVAVDTEPGQGSSFRVTVPCEVGDGPGAS